MSNVTIRIAHEGTNVPVEKIDLGQVTNIQLIQELVNSGQIQAPAAGHEYRLAGKDNEVLNETVILKEAGFKDGDTITLLDKTIGSSCYDYISNVTGDGTDTDDGSGDFDNGYL